MKGRLKLNIHLRVVDLTPELAIQNLKVSIGMTILTSLENCKHFINYNKL